MSETKKYTDTLDDWKSEYLPRLEKSHIYSSLKEDSARTDVEVTALVENVVAYSIQRTKTIIKHMGEYTLHDDVHLFRVLYLMERLLTREIINNLSIPERMLLILSAFFHDIGMAPEEKEVLTWQKIWDASPEIEDETEQQLFYKFKRYYTARPEQQEIIDKLTEQGKNAEISIIKSYLITEFIRQTHAERAREILDKDWSGKIVYRDTDLTVELANICHSHNEDALKLLEFDKNYLCGQNTYACLPLLSIILRLADILDFDAKRTPPILYSHLYVRNPVSLKEWQKHRAVDNWEINTEIIQFSTKCTHPAIEASIHEFCDLIDHELSVCNNIVTMLNEFNIGKLRNISVKFPFKVNREKIRTEKNIQNQPLYTYKNTRFNLSKSQVIDLLMGTKLYGKPEVALRELLQNSIDACLLREAQEIKWGNNYIPEITVKYYRENNEEVLEVSDNGTGMDQNIIDNYYSKVGSSFYKSAEFYNLKAESNANFQPTSRFGIGILSCFMVADTLIVDTKRKYAADESSAAINVTVEGQESIFCIKPSSRTNSGTTTKLYLRHLKNPWEKMTDDEFIESVESVVQNPPFKINIETSKHKKVRDQNSFKKIAASSLKDYSWHENENIRTFEFDVKNEKVGIVGSVLVAILESQNKPKKEIALSSIDIMVENEGYTLEKKLWLSENSITQASNSITVNDDGGISKDNSTRQLAKSKSKLSLHGIEVPTTLFPESWQMSNNQVQISWPFSLILVIDVNGNGDLDLNSSRTEIIMSDKWLNFEEELAFVVCNSLANLVTKTYWKQLKAILIKESKNVQFISGLNRVTI